MVFKYTTSLLKFDSPILFVHVVKKHCLLCNTLVLYCYIYDIVLTFYKSTRFIPFPQAAEAFDEMSDLSLEERVEIVVEVIRELTVATNISDETVLYPQDLSDTNQIISGSVQILRASIQNNTLDRLNEVIYLLVAFTSIVTSFNTG